MHVLWKNCLEEIENQILPENFDTWISPISPQEQHDGVLTLSVPNTFFERCIKENYLDLIEETLETITNKKIEIRFAVQNGGGNGNGSTATAVVEAPGNPASELDEPNIEVVGPAFRDTNLNPKFTFESFVVGTNNQFAHAACQAVAQKPAHTYNRCFYTVQSGWVKPTCCTRWEI